MTKKEIVRMIVLFVPVIIFFGLGVIVRMLRAVYLYAVKIFLVGYSDNCSREAFWE